MGLQEFWEGTLEDVNIYSEAYRENTKRRYTDMYNNAKLIGIAVASYNPIGDAKGKFPKLHDFFPQLFEEEQAKPMDWQIIEDRLRDFATGHNKQIKKEVENQ